MIEDIIYYDTSWLWNSALKSFLKAYRIFHTTIDVLPPENISHSASNAYILIMVTYLHIELKSSQAICSDAVMPPDVESSLWQEKQQHEVSLFNLIDDDEYRITMN